MTITTENRRAGAYEADGVQLVYPFSFRIFEPTDIVVTVGLPETETPEEDQPTEEILTYGEDYSVTFVDGEEHGYITLTAPVEAGKLIVITSDVPALQLTHLTNKGGMFAEVLETAYDRAVVLVQQLQEQVSRSIKVGVTSGATADDYKAELEAVANQAAESASSASASAQQATTVAQQAQTDASNALALASGSVEDSATALAQSNTAIADSASALESATTASNLATQADTNATDALTKAEQALAETTEIDAKVSDAVTEAIAGIEIPGLTKDTITGALGYTPYDGETNELGFASESAITEAVTPIEERVATAESELDALEPRVATNETDIDALEGRATSLEGRVTTTEGNITDVTGRVVALEESSGSSGRTITKSYLGCAFVKVDATNISIKAGTTFLINNKTFPILVDTPVSNPSDGYTAGEDYCVWLLTDGTAQITADPYNNPAVAPAEGAVKIGGFHYGLVAPSTTLATGSFNTATSSPLVSMVWTQDMVDQIAGINAHSLWDLNWRPNCPIDEVRGMTCFEGQFWYDIYFCSSTHLTMGTSRYNTDVASGNVLPLIPPMFGGDGSTTYTRFSWFEAIEIARAHGKRLLQYAEFCACAFGVTEDQAIGGSAETIPLTTRQAGYTSRTGGEQMTGHHYTWGALAIGIGADAWSEENPRGNQFGDARVGVFGGFRTHDTFSGSRCVNWNYIVAASSWGVGLRGACDHLNLL